MQKDWRSTKVGRDKFGLVSRCFVGEREGGGGRGGNLLAGLGLGNQLLNPRGAFLELLELLGAVALAALLDGGPASE